MENALSNLDLIKVNQSDVVNNEVGNFSTETNNLKGLIETQGNSVIKENSDNLVTASVKNSVDEFSTEIVAQSSVAATKEIMPITTKIQSYNSRSISVNIPINNNNILTPPLDTVTGDLTLTNSYSLNYYDANGNSTPSVNAYLPSSLSELQDLKLTRTSPFFENDDFIYKTFPIAKRNHILYHKQNLIYNNIYSFELEEMSKFIIKNSLGKKIKSNFVSAEDKLLKLPHGFEHIVGILNVLSKAIIAHSLVENLGYTLFNTPISGHKPIVVKKLPDTNYGIANTINLDPFPDNSILALGSNLKGFVLLALLASANGDIVIPVSRNNHVCKTYGYIQTNSTSTITIYTDNVDLVNSLLQTYSVQSFNNQENVHSLLTFLSDLFSEVDFKNIMEDLLLQNLIAILLPEQHYKTIPVIIKPYIGLIEYDKDDIINNNYFDVIERNNLIRQLCKANNFINQFIDLLTQDIQQQTTYYDILDDMTSPLNAIIESLSNTINKSDFMHKLITNMEVPGTVIISGVYKDQILGMLKETYIDWSSNDNLSLTLPKQKSIYNLVNTKNGSIVSGTISEVLNGLQTVQVITSNNRITANFNTSAEFLNNYSNSLRNRNAIEKVKDTLHYAITPVIGGMTNINLGVQPAIWINVKFKVKAMYESTIVEQSFSSISDNIVKPVITKDNNVFETRNRLQLGTIDNLFIPVKLKPVISNSEENLKLMSSIGKNKRTIIAQDSKQGKSSSKIDLKDDLEGQSIVNEDTIDKNETIQSEIKSETKKNNQTLFEVGKNKFAEFIRPNRINKDERNEVVDRNDLGNVEESEPK